MRIRRTTPQMTSLSGPAAVGQAEGREPAAGQSAGPGADGSAAMAAPPSVAGAGLAGRHANLADGAEEGATERLGGPAEQPGSQAIREYDGGPARRRFAPPAGALPVPRLGGRSPPLVPGAGATIP